MVLGIGCPPEEKSYEIFTKFTWKFTQDCKEYELQGLAKEELKLAKGNRIAETSYKVGQVSYKQLCNFEGDNGFKAVTYKYCQKKKHRLLRDQSLEIQGCI